MERGRQRTYDDRVQVPVHFVPAQRADVNRALVAVPGRSGRSGRRPIATLSGT
jgi:hypothetical protein